MRTARGPRSGVGLRSPLLKKDVNGTSCDNTKRDCSKGERPHRCAKARKPTGVCPDPEAGRGACDADDSKADNADQTRCEPAKHSDAPLIE